MRAKIAEFLESAALYTILAFVVVCILIGTAGAKQPKAKFYDFNSEFIINLSACRNLRLDISFEENVQVQGTTGSADPWPSSGYYRFACPSSGYYRFVVGGSTRTGLNTGLDRDLDVLKTPTKIHAPHFHVFQIK